MKKTVARHAFADSHTLNMSGNTIAFAGASTGSPPQLLNSWIEWHLMLWHS